MGEKTLCKNKSIGIIKKAKKELFNSPDIFISWGSGSRMKYFKGNDNDVIFKAGVGKVSLREGCPCGGVSTSHLQETLLFCLRKSFCRGLSLCGFLSCKEQLAWEELN